MANHWEIASPFFLPYFAAYSDVTVMNYELPFAFLIQRNATVFLADKTAVPV